jgi:uncharacterized protein (TIGR02118 family)
MRGTRIAAPRPFAVTLSSSRMIRATVLYPNVPGSRFDFDYYLRTHVPFARTLLGSSGLVRLEVDRGVSGEEEGSAPPYTCAAHLYFHSESAFYAAMTAHGEELGSDVERYTDVELSIQVSEILG